MANVLGQHLPVADLQFEQLMRCPTAKLHLYGKDQPNENRKMGHITVTADCADTAEAQVREARASMLAAGAK
jgi:5-(carboxyamino)imidazole ribonucleotide synthase